MLSICSREALRPARSVAGSAVGRTLKIVKTTALTITSRAMAQSSAADDVAEHRVVGGGSGPTAAGGGAAPSLSGSGRLAS